MEERAAVGEATGDQRAAVKGEKGVRNSNLLCTTCGKLGRLKDRCWATYPDLQRRKKTQGVEGGQAEVPLGGIRIAMIDACGCDVLENPPSSSPWISIKNTRGFAQKTAACSDNLSVVGDLKGTDNLSVVGGFVKPRVSTQM